MWFCAGQFLQFLELELERALVFGREIVSLEVMGDLSSGMTDVSHVIENRPIGRPVPV